MHDPISSYPRAMTHDHAVAIVKSYVLMATKDRLGRDVAVQSRFLALDAIEALERGEA